MRQFGGWTTALLGLAVSWPLHADWTVAKLSGEAWVVSSTAREPLHLGDKAADDALLETGVGARLEMRGGLGVIFLGAKTKMKMHPQGEAQADPMRLIYGKIRMHVQPPTGSTFRVETKAAVSGVRGTEYFIQSDDTRDFICTLSGLVAVQSKLSGQSVLVPPRAGVEIAPGKSFEVKPTADDLVDKWYNDTSAEDRRPIVTDSYSQLDLRFHELSPLVRYGLRVHANFIDLDHVSYNALRAPTQNQISQVRVSPALRLGDITALTWIPRLLYHAASEPVLLDAEPTVARESYARADVGELFAETDWAGTAFKVGRQGLKWNDGVLFSFNFWGLDPYVFSGLRVTRSVGRHFFDLFLARQGDVGEVNGQVPADILAFKYDYSTWVSLFAAHLDFTSGSAVTPALYQGHLVDDFGLLSTKRVGRADYKLSAIVQSGKLFETVPTVRQRADGAMLELGLGWYPLAEQNFRLGIGYIEAGKDLLPGFESPYNLGYSQIFMRSNLRQYRAKISYAPAEARWSAFLEWIRSQSVGHGTFTRWSAVNRDLMDEVDLGVNVDLLENWKTLFTVFSAAPTLAMSDSSPKWSRQTGYGGVLNLQFVY